MLGITTIGDAWKDKVKEIDELGIDEAALFPTYLDMEQRKIFYELLEKSKLKRAPHVHLRHDCESWEVEYFIKRYETKVFNIHARIECLEFLNKYPQYRNIIYVENTLDIDVMFLEVLNKCAGICLDVAHWEQHANLYSRSSYNNFSAIIKKHKIGINHISAFAPTDEYVKDPVSGKDIRLYDQHRTSDLKQFDYVKKYLSYLSDYISIELDNNLKEQLKVKQYLEEVIHVI